MKKHIYLFVIICTTCLCKNYAQNKISTVVIKNLEINTPASDFGASIVNDSTFYFSSIQNKNKIFRNFWKNEVPFLDIYKATKNNIGIFQKDKILIDLLNTKYHESSIVFSPDGNKMYFTRSNYINGEIGKTDAKGNITLKLFVVEKKDSLWGMIQSLPFNSDNYSVGHPAISTDGKKLYFVSDMPGSIGMTDLFVVDILGENLYSQPRNLGKQVNTIGREVFPFIDQENTLYFSSDSRKERKGKLDIYYAHFKDSLFLKPQLMESPINSSEDDFSFIKLKNKNKGYFSSNRYGGKGSDDIYSFEGETNAVKCISKSSFLIIDAKSKKEIATDLIEVYSNTTGILLESFTNRDNFVISNTECSASYKIKITAKEYKTKEYILTSKKGTYTYLIEVEKKLKSKILAEKNITLDTKGRIMIDIGNIYFASNSSKIGKTAQSKLDVLIKLMKKYPTIKVEIGAHTDSKGRDAYNLNLSEKRAESTKKYVWSQEIKMNRIYGKGYGETELLNNCFNNVKCSKKQHQENRRTEFIITEIDSEDRVLKKKQKH